MGRWGWLGLNGFTDGCCSACTFLEGGSMLIALAQGLRDVPKQPWTQILLTSWSYLFSSTSFSSSLSLTRSPSLSLYSSSKSSDSLCLSVSLSACLSSFSLSSPALRLLLGMRACLVWSLPLGLFSSTLSPAKDQSSSPLLLNL